MGLWRRSGPDCARRNAQALQLLPFSRRRATVYLLREEAGAGVEVSRSHARWPSDEQGMLSSPEIAPVSNLALD